MEPEEDNTPKFDPLAALRARKAQKAGLYVIYIYIYIYIYIRKYKYFDIDLFLVFLCYFIYLFIYLFIYFFSPQFQKKKS